MTAVTMPRERALLVLAELARGKDPQLAAELAGERPATVKALADAIGWPDLSRVHAEVRRLEAARDQDLRRGGTTTPAAALVPPAPAVRRRSPQVQDVPVTQLHGDPANPRRTLRDVPDLAASIADVGLLQPILARVHSGRLVVVAGHRRLAAVRSLGWSTVPVLVNRTIRPDDVLAAALAENNQRADLDPIEEARALAELQRRDALSVNALAAKVGRSHPWVAGRLALLELDSGQREQVRAGNLSLAAAAELTRTTRTRTTSTGTRVPASRPAPATSWHLSAAHPLAALAADRCTRADHAKGRRLPGSQACGVCWEAAIRADR
jgi:ParB family chromosome partitioning protein